MRSLATGAYLALLLATASASPAMASDAPASAYVGRWALRIDGHSLFILDLKAAQNIGQPQIYGAQFTARPGVPVTQAPMDGPVGPRFHS